MRSLKQKPGSKNCVAVVAAMAFDTTVEEFEEFIEPKPKGGYSDIDFMKFALHKGYQAGLVLMFPPVDEKNQIQDIDINKLPAYVVVKSETDETKAHTLYWDGQNLWDPNPTAADHRPLTDYKIYVWCPIVKLYESK